MVAPLGRRRVIALLALMTLAAAVNRAVGLDYGMPLWSEPDPNVPIHVGLERRGAERPDPLFSDQQYPHLLAELVLLLPRRPARDGPGAPTTLEGHLRAASHTHLQVRAIVALLSVLIVPGTFLLARKFTSSGWALFAAALAATSLLHLSFSQQARPHGAAVGLYVFAVLAAMRVARRGDTASYALAGAGAAVSIGVLQSGIAVLIPLTLAHVLRARSGGRWFDPRALLPVALVLVGIRLYYPFLFGDKLGDELGLRLEKGNVIWVEHSVRIDQWDGDGFTVVARSLWNYEPVLLVLLVLAVVAWVARRRWSAGPDALIALAFAVPYFAVIGMYEETYERFALPLVPYLAAFAAVQMGAVADRRRAVVALLVASLAIPTFACAKLAWLRARPDTLELAAEWIRAEVEPETEPVFLLGPLDVPLFRTAESLRPGGERIPLFSRWTRYQVRLPEGHGPPPLYDLRWMTTRASEAARDPELVVNTHGSGLYLIEHFERRVEHPLKVGLRDILRSRGERVARFSPDGEREDTEMPFFFMLSDHFNYWGLDEWPHFVARLARASAIGPVVEIYRLP